MRSVDKWKTFELIVFVVHETSRFENHNYKFCLNTFIEIRNLEQVSCKIGANKVENQRDNRHYS